MLEVKNTVKELKKMPLMNSLGDWKQLRISDLEDMGGKSSKIKKHWEKRLKK